MHLGLKQPWVPDLFAVHFSTEPRVIDSAEILANATALPFTQTHNSGERDRSSSGYLPPAEFEHVADPFLAYTTESARGWETANEAPSRVVKALSALVESDKNSRLPRRRLSWRRRAPCSSFIRRKNRSREPRINLQTVELTTTPSP